MKKKKGNTSKSTIDKKLTIKENKVRITSASKFEDVDITAQYYFMYFMEMNVIAIYKGDHSKRKKIELPFLLIRLKDIQNVNFRIPQMLNDMSVDFTEDSKSLGFKFNDEDVKNDIGNSIKKIIKTQEKLKDTPENSYSDVELKYKIAKILETMNFESFKENYDYRKYLDFDYLHKFHQIYNNKSDVYKYLYNRLFIGKLAVVTKKRELIRKRTQSE